MSSPEEYQAKADEVLARLAEAKTEAERAQLRRAYSAYMKLTTHGAEAAARAGFKPERLKSEKTMAAERSAAPAQFRAR